MRVGKLRHPIRIEQPVEGRSDYGSKTITRWELFYETLADIDPPKGREAFAAGQTQSSVTQRIRIRYVKDLALNMRVVFNARIFHINAIINPDERDRELILMCMERV